MKIVIVGGGAGGLELACKLAKKHGRHKVVLVDKARFHIWKPSLHEVASGTLDIHQEGLSYQMLAFQSGFTFVWGAMSGLNKENQTITLNAVCDEEGRELFTERTVAYDQLVLAVGSVANYFGIEGAKEHTIALTEHTDAERFRLRFLQKLTLADQTRRDGHRAKVHIVIIGAGATGVELAAELREASLVHSNYGCQNLDPISDVSIRLIEGGARILGPLPEEVSEGARKLLVERSVEINTNCRVAKIESECVIDTQGNRYEANITVWAAGIWAPDWLTHLGLPCSKGNQIQVEGDLRVKGEQNIWAMGDCAQLVLEGGFVVPPRAQAAHQMSDYIAKHLLAISQIKPQDKAPFAYKDYGALVSLGTQNSVGSLMGNLFKNSWLVEGWLARGMYVSLHLMHHVAILGVARTGVLALARFLIKRTKPLVKLH